MSIALWLAAFIILIAAAVAVSARGRAAPSGLVVRGVPLGFAVLLAGLAAAVPWVWGGTAAIDGRAERLRAGVPVRLVLASVAIDVDKPTTIGWSPTADLRLPTRGSGSETADLLRLERTGDDLAVQGFSTDQKVSNAFVRTVIVVGRGEPAVVASRGLAGAGGCAGAVATGGAVAVRDGEVVVGIACRDGAPVAAIAVRRAARVEITPLRWRGRFVPSTLEVRAGDVLQLGAVGVALPGVTAWEMPAPAGRGALLAVPADPTSCAAWRDALGGTAGDATARATTSDGRCAVGDGTFTLVARPIAPDADAVVGRGIRVAIAIAAPAVLLLIGFAAAVGSRRRARVLGALARVAVVAAGLTALLAWRLLWAHRIDVLRDLDPAGARVAANLLSAALVGASLAGVAVSRLIDGSTLRIAASLVTWAVWAAAAIVLLDAPIAIDRASAFHVAGQLLLSLLGAVGLPVIERLVATRVAGAGLPRVSPNRSADTGSRQAPDSTPPHVPERALAPEPSSALRLGDTLHAPGDTPPAHEPDGEDDELVAPAVPLRARIADGLGALGAGHLLLAIAAAAVVTRMVAPGFVLAKLGLAYAVVIAGHAALRAAVAPGAAHRRAFHALALAPAIVAVAALDVGVAVAIVGVGLALAMVVAGHDAVYDSAQGSRLGVLEREHARLVALHAVAAIAGAIAATAWAVLAGDQDLLERSTGAVLHAPLVAAIVFLAAAGVARSHHRPWMPWLAGALAALALWGARDLVVDRAIAGDGVGSHRVAVVVDPGYALLRDDHRFVASVAAWREAALPADVDVWTGQGYFGARLADPGVVVSIENDYLPVLVARERGVGGLVQTTLLLLALVVAAGATAAARLGHASRAHRARWLAATVVGALCVYQPLAALGILPLTGISWPGLGVDSPADLWLVVLGAIWIFLGADRTAAASRTAVGRAGLSKSAARVALAAAHESRAATVDERIRSAPRLRRARRVAAAALAITGLAGVALVARAGSSALGRGVTAARRGAASGDARIDRALGYAASLACPWTDQTGKQPDDVVPVALLGTPTDASTARFAAELAATWAADRPTLLSQVTTCTGRAGAWTLTAESDTTCRATLDTGWPRVELALTHTAETWRATCAIQLPDDAVPLLDTHKPPHAPRIRLVSAPLGVAASDLGELVASGTIIRLRPAAVGAPPPAAPPATTAKGKRSAAAASKPTGVDTFVPAAQLDASAATSAPGMRVATSVALGGGVTIDVRADKHDVVVRGPAEILIAAAASGDAPTAWRRQPAADGERVLDRLTLVVAGDPGRRRVWLFRPPSAFGADGTPMVDPLLADDVRRAGDRTRRTYAYGAALPELGWTNPFDIDHSLGLDGWVHAALAVRDPSGATAATPPDAAAAMCGTLAPPAIARQRVCAPSPLDGVVECRVALQPELALALRAVSERIIDEPVATIGRPMAPTRAAYVVMRGDTGEVLAQGDIVPGRGASAYAPVDAAAETTLIRLREDRDPRTGAPTTRGESDGERADWNLPIAIGSTLKPLFARAAEQAFPAAMPDLLMTSIGRADTTCRRSRSGRRVSPMVGHCPPTPLTGDPTTADLHDFLARSPNWYMAALGVVGLGLPAGNFSVADIPLTLGDIVTSDLAAWPTERPLVISDSAGPILGEKGVVIEGLRRTPLWSRFEAVLGRPLCTLGDQAACRRAAERRDVCAARGLPIKAPTRDLRHLVALGPDRLHFYGDDRPGQRVVATREYFQLLRGSGVHSIGSLAQLTDAFSRVIYDPTESGAMRLAASWFPSPPVGVAPGYRCTDAAGHAATVRGVDGGLCAVMRPGGTAHAALSSLLDDPRVAIYGGKTGTIDSLADIARRPKACAAWNARHTIADRPRDRAHQPGWLDCGATPPDDSLFVLAFGVVTPRGTIPITVGVQLQRGGKGAAARATRLYVDAITAYLQ
jgi:hypothetical protein